jgi:hypothetical protein
VVKDCSTSNQFCSQGSCSGNADDYVARYAMTPFSTIYTLTVAADEYTVHADRLLTEVAVHINPSVESSVDHGYYGVYEVGASGTMTQMAYGPIATATLDPDGYVSSPPISLTLKTGHKYEVVFTIWPMEFAVGQEPTYADAAAPQDVSFGQAIGGGADGTGGAWIDESNLTSRLITQRLRTAPPP